MDFLPDEEKVISLLFSHDSWYNSSRYVSIIQVEELQQTAGKLPCLALLSDRATSNTAGLLIPQSTENQSQRIPIQMVQLHTMQYVHQVILFPNCL